MTKIAETDPRADPEAWDRTYAELVALLQQEEDPETTPESLERTLNYLLLAPGHSPEVVDLAAELVLGGVPSAVFLDERDPAGLTGADAINFDPTRTSNPC